MFCSNYITHTNTQNGIESHRNTFIRHMQYMLHSLRFEWIALPLILDDYSSSIFIMCIIKRLEEEEKKIKPTVKSMCMHHYNKVLNREFGIRETHKVINSIFLV